MKIESLGLLGLGSRTTLFYIKELNRLYFDKKGGYTTCPFKLWNANFDAINNLLPETSSKLDVLLQNCLTELQNLKVDAVLIPNITLHETIDRIIAVPGIINAVNLTIAKLKEGDFTKVVLFGSLHTMESDYLKIKFKNEGISILLPSEEERLFIDNLRKSIHWETESMELLKEYNHLIKKYSAKYPVVLACTELPIGWNSSHINIFDMSRIQIGPAVENMD